MKIAVTGANGFVGRAVIASLAAAGHDALPLARRAGALPGAAVIGDLSERAPDPSVLIGADAIIHLAARAHVMSDTATDALAAYRAINVTGTGHLLEAAQRAGIKRFVYVSSVKAVGERSTPGQPLSPDSPTAPEDVYGISKAEAETLVAAQGDRAGMGWTIVRPPMVYGPHVAGNFERLIALANRQLPLPLGGIANRRSIIAVGNLADALVAACHAPGAAGRVLMLADACLSTPALLHAVGAALGKRQRLIPIPPGVLQGIGALTGRRGMVDRLCQSLEIDAEGSWRALDLTPKATLEQSLAATIAAWRQDKAA